MTTPDPEGDLARTAEEVFRRAGEQVEVGEAPVAAVVARATVGRRRRLGALLLPVLALVLVAACLSWWGARSGGPSPQAGMVRAVGDEEPVWWSAGVLHLPDATVELDRVRAMFRVGDGVVVDDGAGHVLLVDADGTVTRLGEKWPRSEVAVSAARHTVAWADSHRQEIVLRDLTTGRTVGSWGLGLYSLSADVLAVDGNRVFYQDPGGTWTWSPPWDARPVAAGLLDVAAATIVRQADDAHVEVVQPFLGMHYQRRGQGAMLSPGGDYLLTRRPGGPARDSYRPVVLYSTRTGQRLWTGVRPDDVVLAAALGSHAEVTYLVAPGAGTPWAGGPGSGSDAAPYGGPYELRTCLVGQHTCFIVDRVVHGSVPVLAE